MKKIFYILFVSLICFSSVFVHTAKAQVPPKLKAFLLMAGYGAGGGAILGAASTAFGTSSRAVPQGASLGLYAGIIFGTYVLVSHHNKRYGSYEDSSSPYQDSSDIYGDEYQDDQGGSGGGDETNRDGFFDRFQVIQEKFNGGGFSSGGKKRGSSIPPLYLNLFHFNF
jgi:hypothetical protein